MLGASPGINGTVYVQVKKLLRAAAQRVLGMLQMRKLCAVAFTLTVTHCRWPVTPLVLNHDGSGVR